MFSKIYNEARKAAEKNIEIYNKENEELKQYQANTSKEEQIRNSAEGAKWNIVEGMPKEDKVESLELFDIIQRLNFEVFEYGKRIDEVRYDEYEPIVEYYSVKYKNYKFIVNHLEDVDITEGIFSVYEIENINSGEKIKYYLDLGCRNTGEAKLEYFLMLLDSDSEENFLEKKYSFVKQIPELLIKNGYTEVEDNVKYKTDSIKGNIKINNSVYVIPYLAWMNEIRLVVTNAKKWDVNSSNDYSTIGYYVEYKSENDINVLINNIKALEKHVAGEYGFFENGRYYNNQDLDKIININKKDKDGNYLDCFNHYHVRIEETRPWDCRGYGAPYINVYKGLEIARHFEISFNDAAQWSIGNIINTSDIIVKYDKRIDKNNCILMIRNYQYTDEDEYWMGYDDEDELEKIDSFNNKISEDFLIDEVEFKGTFTEVLSILRTYLNNLCEIFNIEKVF